MGHNFAFQVTTILQANNKKEEPEYKPMPQCDVLYYSAANKKNIL